ncbi:hypothetical protein KFL_004610120 [Klebsormidium nitens]|uniref:Phytanoyl-CoA dioxygenase n=1 Tax=Klebsormidium nitens TaxID=105231 RepID=A0A1Y1IJL8_KLENI|nr:hypothetical protein KFL_004610120 [Klebsormidium nitens]|eukprot:GAQ88817.1 hypothetical protein KFL_004610120 [Klebsormidium nitens]
MQAITEDASPRSEHKDSKRLVNRDKGEQIGTVNNVEKQSPGKLQKNIKHVVKNEAEGEASKQLDGRWKEAVDTEVKVSLKQLLQFERTGHVLVRQLVPEEAMEECAEEIWAAAREQELEAYRHRVAVLCPGVDASSVSNIEQALAVLAEHATDELGFLQMFNLHRYSRTVRELVTSPRLARVAADLLGASKVRLYQDCLFLKQPGFGATNWHSDLNMVPLDTNAFVTLWIPLRAMDEDDSGLLFASGSHRDFSLAYWQDLEGMEDLERREYLLEDHGALDLGDATCHHGWCLHYASPQPEDSDARAALSISYFADGARVLDTRHARRKPHDEDAWSFRGWRQALREGDLANHPLLPLVYPAALNDRKDVTKRKKTRR